MGTFANEVIRAARMLGITVEKLEKHEAREIRSKVEQRYSPGVRRWPLWEATQFPTAVQDERAWTLIEEFIGQQTSILFFNPTDDSAMFRIQSGEQLNSLLGETFGFEFYVADEGSTFLFCFNHHDMLLGAGAASDWLGAKAKQNT